MALTAAAALGGAAISAGGAVGSAFLTPDEQLAMPVVPPPTKRERRLRRRILQDLGIGRETLLAGVGQQQLLTPEMYRMLGLEPIIERQDAGLSRLLQRREQLRGQLDAVRKLPPEERQAYRQARGIPTPGRIRRELGVLEGEIGRIQAQPMFITGFEAAAAGAEETGLAELMGLGRGRLEAVLRGEEPDDPRLVRQLDEQEQQMRLQLRRQLGPGFETSTPGIEALREFEAYRRETLARARRADVELFGGQLLPSLSNLESARIARVGAQLQQLAYPGQLGIIGGERIQAAAGRYLPLAELLQRERLAPIAGTRVLDPSAQQQSFADLSKWAGQTVGSWVAGGGMAPLSSSSDYGFGSDVLESGRFSIAPEYTLQELAL